MSRNDLPSEKASNFSARLRETIQTMLGTRGDKLDRVLTLRDLTENDLIKLRPGATVGAGTLPLLPGDGLGSGGEPVYVPDLTPPPQPDTLIATPAISHVLIEVPPALYQQGHGHLRTRVYGANPTPANPTPTFDDAVEVGQFSGTVWAMASNPATTWRLWAKWETNDNVLSATPAGGPDGVIAPTGQDVSSLVSAMTGAGNPFTILSAPTVIDGVTFPAGTYSTQAFIQDAQVTNAKIANLAVDNAKIANLSADKLTAGSIAVGEYIQGAVYTPGSAGWRINGDGTAEFSGVVVRGTVFATAGQIGGITIAANAVRAGQTAYNTGSGFHLGSDGRLSLGNSAGNNLTWDGASLSVRGTINGSTINGGTMNSGAINLQGDGAAGWGYARSLNKWWGDGSNGWVFARSGSDGSTFSEMKAGDQRIWISSWGDCGIQFPGITMTNGGLTISQANVINTLNIAGNAVAVSASASGNNSASTNLNVPSGVVATVFAISIARQSVPTSAGTMNSATHSVTIAGNTASIVGYRRFTVDSLYQWEPGAVANQVDVVGPATVSISTTRSTGSGNEVSPIQLMAFARWR